MRVLLSGVIGAVASSAAWLAAEHFQQTNYGWMVCFIGLITGLFVHKASKAGSRGGFARGALAAVLTLAAIVGGQKAYAVYMQSTSQAASAVAAQNAPVVTEPAGDDTAKDVAPAELLMDLGEEAIGRVPSSYTQSAIKKNLSDWDMVWMGIAALAAYVTGKGSEAVASVVAEERREDADERQDVAEHEED